MKWTIQKKLLVMLVPVILLAVGIMAYVSYQDAKETILDLEEKRTLLTVEKTIHDVNLWLDERKVQIKLLAQEQVFRDALLNNAYDEASNRLALTHRGMPYLEAMFLANPNGEIIVDSIGGKAVGVNISQIDVYRENVSKARQGMLFLGEVQKSPATGRPVMLLTAPVYSGQNLIGVFGTPIDVMTLSEMMIDNIKIGKSGYVYVLAEDGTFVAHPTKKNILNLNINDLDFGPALMKLKNGTMYYNFAGDDRVAHVKTDSKTGWLYGTSMLESELLDPVNQMAMLILFIGLGSLLFLIAALVIFSNRLIAKPLGRAVETLNDIAKGNLNVQFDVDTNDEVGDLAKAVSDMIAAEKEMSNAAMLVSKGDLTVNVTPRSNADELAYSLEGMISVVKNLKDDIQQMISEQSEGDLESRCNPEKFSGAFNELSDGINHALNVITEPVIEAIGIIEEYGNGVFEKKLRDLPGKQMVLTNAMNGIRDNLLNLTEEVQQLIRMAVEGKLDARGDADRFNASYKDIVKGVNEILEAMVKPIAESSSVLEQLSARDLTARMEGEYSGDYDKIKQSLNKTADALEDAMAQVASASDQVASAGNQIASSSQSVAEGASEQASSLEETSSSLEEMSSMTKQNAKNAQEANNMAKQAHEAASVGSRSMKDMEAAMTKIKESTEGTAAIIRDINDIAFQTNLLALNAAVEAARAGEAGRGFSVVAEEVRNLALRAKEAAKKTETLIIESVDQTAEGERLTVVVNENFAEIVSSVEKVNAIVEEISSASNEQSKGIDQINYAVSEMDKVTQQNAANSEEAASSSEELSSQAQELAALVAQFQIRKEKASVISYQSESTPARDDRNKNKQKMIPGKSGYQLSPEDTIILDEDEDWKDF